MLRGKTAIVTGGAGDLGQAMARQLAEQGAHVVIWDIVPQADAAAAIERVRAHDPLVEYAEVDVRDRVAVDRAIADLPQLDIVCSNAGIVEAQPFLELSEENGRIPGHQSDRLLHSARGRAQDGRRRRPGRLI